MIYFYTYIYIFEVFDILISEESETEKLNREKANTVINNKLGQLSSLLALQEFAQYGLIYVVLYDRVLIIFTFLEGRNNENHLFIKSSQPTDLSFLFFSHMFVCRSYTKEEKLSYFLIIDHFSCQNKDERESSSGEEETEDESDDSENEDNLESVKTSDRTKIGNAEDNNLNKEEISDKNDGDGEKDKDVKLSKKRKIDKVEKDGEEKEAESEIK